MPAAPESVRIGLAAVRPTLHLRWNPTAVLRTGGSFTADGAVIPAEHDPRWEVWDTDADGREYRVMTLRHPDGSFKPPGDWLVEFVNFINPARWDGDPNKMLEAMIDLPEERREMMLDKESEDMIAATADWGAWAILPKSRVVADTKKGQWSTTPAEDAAVGALAEAARPARPGSKILTTGG